MLRIFFLITALTLFAGASFAAPFEFGSGGKSSQSYKHSYNKSVPHPNPSVRYDSYYNSDEYFGQPNSARDYNKFHDQRNFYQDTPPIHNYGNGYQPLSPNSGGATSNRYYQNLGNGR